MRGNMLTWLSPYKFGVLCCWLQACLGNGPPSHADTPSSSHCVAPSWWLLPHIQLQDPPNLHLQTCKVAVFYINSKDKNSCRNSGPPMFQQTRNSSLQRTLSSAWWFLPVSPHIVKCDSANSITAMCVKFQSQLGASDYLNVNCRIRDSASAISRHSLLVEDYDKSVVIEGCIPVAVCQHKEALIPSRVVSDIPVQHLFGVVHLELPQSKVLHNGFPMSPSVIVLLILGKTLCCKLQFLHAHMLHLNILLNSCPQVERRPWGSDSATGKKHQGRLRLLQSSQSRNWLVAARPLQQSWCAKGLL